MPEEEGPQEVEPSTAASRLSDRAPKKGDKRKERSKKDKKEKHGKKWKKEKKSRKAREEEEQPQSIQAAQACRGMQQAYLSSDIGHVSSDIRLSLRMPGRLDVTGSI